VVPVEECRLCSDCFGTAVPKREDTIQGASALPWLSHYPTHRASVTPRV